MQNPSTIQRFGAGPAVRDSGALLHSLPGRLCGVDSANSRRAPGATRRYGALRRLQFVWKEAVRPQRSGDEEGVLRRLDYGGREWIVFRERRPGAAGKDGCIPRPGHGGLVTERARERERKLGASLEHYPILIKHT